MPANLSITGSRLTTLFTFLRAWTRNPRTVGAILPSSAKLARQMAGMLDTIGPDDLVVELGAGTGVVTEAILKQGIAPKQLLIFEMSPEMAAVLRRRFPEVVVVCDNCINMARHLENGKRPKAIVSSLPFKSIGHKHSMEIAACLRDLLAPGGQIIQFTYAILNGCTTLKSVLHCTNSAYVWLNVPPARVDRFTKMV